MADTKRVVQDDETETVVESPWQFDFSKISAAQMSEFTIKNNRILVREPLAILRLCLVQEPEGWPEDLGQLPFAQIIPLRKAFIEAAKRIEADSSKDFRFDVDSITGGDVEDFMHGALSGNIEAQARVMARYELSLQVDTEKRLEGWKKGWSGKDKKFYAETGKAILIEHMNLAAMLAHPYSVFAAARASFMDEVINFGKNLNGQS